MTRDLPQLRLSEKFSFVPTWLIVTALTIGFTLSMAGFVLAFVHAPLVKGANLSATVLIADQAVSNKLLFSQKIFYFHVPVAIASFATFVFTAYYGVRYLMTKRADFDRRATIATQVTVVFVLATMVSGMLWTRFEWGVWWVWEPRLTTYFILTLMVIGYFVLRNAIDDPERRATFCSVFGIIAFLNAPLSFGITRLVPSSIHPVVIRSDSGLSPDMLIPFLLGIFGMLMLAFALYHLRYRSCVLADETEAAKERLEKLLQVTKERSL